jgi:U3 small nucleolar RNA-associated protein 7
MSHLVPKGSMQSIKFCPFDDTLGLGHSLGFSSIVVPGSGEPNFDSFEINPFETRKQNRESEVRMILEKIQSDTIYLNNQHIGSLKSTPKSINPKLKPGKPKREHNILDRFK